MISTQRFWVWLTCGHLLIVIGRQLIACFVAFLCFALEMTIERGLLGVNSNLKCPDLRPSVVTNGGTGLEGPVVDRIMGAQVNSVIQCIIRAWHSVLCVHRCA